MTKIFKILSIWFIIGCLYFVLEGLWRIPTTGGYANIVMLPIGGLCGLCLGSINQIPKFYNMKIIYQSLIGSIIITSIEFISGCILNIWLNLGIWNYSNTPFNICGQVCLLYSFLWFLICPFGIWLEDIIRYKLWDEGEYYSLKSIYIDLFTLK